MISILLGTILIVKSVIHSWIRNIEWVPKKGREREIEWQRDRWRATDRERQTERVRQRETDRERQTDRETDTQRLDRQRGKDRDRVKCL